MTRKRFIRLLMAEGIQRNQAHDIAFRMWVIHENWEESYRHFRLVKHHLPDLTVRMGDYIHLINDAMNRVKQQLIESVESLILYGTGGRNHEENTGH